MSRDNLFWETNMKACTLILVAGALLGQNGKSKGALSPAQQAAVVNAVRAYALNYTKSLPNYTCTLTTRHIADPPNAGNKEPPKRTDTEEQFSFVDGKELRAVTRIDGKPVSLQPGEQLSEMSQGEFGNFLDSIFEPAAGAVVRWDRAATLDKLSVDVLAFRMPQSKGYVLTARRGSMRVPFEGFVYADAQTHAVLRIQMKCIMIPDTFPIQSVDLAVDYKPAQVAGREFLLPSHFVLNYFNHENDRQHVDDGRYSDYHQFSTDATLKF